MMSGRSPAIGRQWLLLCIPLVAGCAAVRLPAIDPSGQRVFLPYPASTTLAPGLHGSCFPRPAFPEPPPIPDCPTPALGPGVPVLPPPPQVVSPATLPGGSGALVGQDQLVVAPARIVAPVNSEVVLLGGICAADGHYVVRQPIEWMLSQDSVGAIVEVGEDSHLHRLTGHGTRKLSNSYALTHSSQAARLITRGTTTPADDVWLKKGQSWITVTSPSEGISYVTAVATGAENWDRRRQVSRIHWVDAQWVLPPPGVVPAGQSHTLVTTVSRSSSSQPVADWVVRYEVADGAPAVFHPERAAAVERQTDAAGRAVVELVPESTTAGSTQVRITILSSSAGEAGSPVVVGEGWTTIHWSAPALAVQASGPQIAALDATVTYSIAVANSGDLPAANVTVSAVLPPSFVFLNGQPPPQRFADRLEWPLGELAAGARTELSLNVRAARPGDVRLRVRATADGQSHESTVATRIVAPALEVRIVDGPTSATVGQRLHFNVEVANVGSGRLTNVDVRDVFDAGLEHTYGEASPIQRSLGDLEPGQVRQFGVSFVATRTGRHCHTLQATAEGGHSDSARACVDVAEPRRELRVEKSGPAQARVGDQVDYLVQVTNTGDAPLTNLMIEDQPSAALAPVPATAELRWQIAELGPGETQTRRIVCRCLIADQSAENSVTVTTAEGLREVDTVITEVLPTDPPRSPAAGAPSPVPLGPATGRLRLTVSNPENRVRVGQTTTYLLEVINDRAESDRNVVVTFALSSGLEFVRFVSISSDLSLQERTDGAFAVETIREIRAGGRRTFRIEVTARQVGDQVFRAQAVSLRTGTPVEAQQPMRVEAG